LTFNQKPYFNADSFPADIRTIFVSYIDAPRGLAVFAPEVAVLLMNGCSADVSEYVIRFLTEARICIITFALQAAQVFQVLILTVFGVLKRCPRYELPFDDVNATVRVITKVYHDFTQTMVPCNIWRVFRAFGLEFDMRRELYGLLFDEVKLRENAGFQALCSVTFPWTSYRSDDVLLGSVGSTGLSKST
jgi:hypothetical protein